MLAVKLFVIPCALIGFGVTLLGLFFRGTALERSPLNFGQATVVAKKAGGTASFELFDGQVIDLAVEPEALGKLQVGDYGRLTYRAGRFVKLERS